MKLFSHVKEKILKKKQNIASDIAYILNGVIVHSVNSGSGFYIGEYNIDKSQDD